MNVDHYIVAWFDRYNERHYNTFGSFFEACGAYLTLAAESWNYGITVNAFDGQGKRLTSLGD